MKINNARDLILGFVFLVAGTAPHPALCEQKCDHGCPGARDDRTRLSVDQLEQVVREAQGKPDDRMAPQLLRLRLSERLNPAKLFGLEELVAGNASRSALRELADLSAFELPPASELPSNPVPSVEAQRRWLTQAVEYAASALSKLPNFYATRNVAYFADTPATQSGSVFLPYQTLHAVGNSSATVLYRDGREVVDESERRKSHEPPPRGLITSGEFGPLLGTVLADAARGSIRWDHWEHGPDDGIAAVYRYAVAPERSHYQVTFCCVSEGTAMKLYRQVSGYHGEISVDPVTGAILRLTLQADLRPKHPMEMADILIEYGRVEIGGKNYICPQRSLAIATAAARSDPEASEKLQFRGMLSEESKDYALPMQTLLNEISFDQYHLFRSDVRILPATGITPPSN